MKSGSRGGGAGGAEEGGHSPSSYGCQPFQYIPGVVCASRYSYPSPPPLCGELGRSAVPATGGETGQQMTPPARAGGGGGGLRTDPNRNSHYNSVVTRGNISVGFWSQ